jgi:N6-adenosine-specific RNA methylase IME4
LQPGGGFFVQGLRMKIDPEFKALIPPLAPEEYAQLESNIIAEGCRDPLVVWDGVLVDGHNRYEICTKHDIGFETVAKEFKDRDEAMDWMDANQLGRRNLSPDAFKLALGRRYNRTKKAKGGTGANQHKQMGQIEPSATAEILARQHSVSAATVKRAGKFAEEVEKTPELQKAIAERKPVLQVKREIKEANREARREANRAKVSEVESPQLLAKAGAKFATIVIDPPWDWGDEGDVDQLGRARPQYATMSKEQLLDLPLSELSDDDCHIYLWITNRSLPKGFELLERWGFRYVTAITWVKPHFGMGNYFRGQTEHVLFGVKGSQPLKRRDVGTVFNAPRGPIGHSSKPIEFYELVESCSPGPYIEMFSRCERKDWKAWGENA